MQGWAELGGHRMRLVGAGVLGPGPQVAESPRSPSAADCAPSLVLVGSADRGYVWGQVEVPIRLRVTGCWVSLCRQDGAWDTGLLLTRTHGTCGPSGPWRAQMLGLWQLCPQPLSCAVQCPVCWHLHPCSRGETGSLTLPDVSAPFQFSHKMGKDGGPPSAPLLLPWETGMGWGN